MMKITGKRALEMHENIWDLVIDDLETHIGEFYIHEVKENAINDLGYFNLYSDCLGCTIAGFNRPNVIGAKYACSNCPLALNCLAQNSPWRRLEEELHGHHIGDHREEILEACYEIRDCGLVSPYDEDSIFEIGGCND